MRVPLSWLRDYVDVQLTPEQLAANGDRSHTARILGEFLHARGRAAEVHDLPLEPRRRAGGRT